jgi:hypothetical protein
MTKVNRPVIMAATAAVVVGENLSMKVSRLADRLGFASGCAFGFTIGPAASRVIVLRSGHSGPDDRLTRRYVAASVGFRRSQFKSAFVKRFRPRGCLAVRRRGPDSPCSNFLPFNFPLSNFSWRSIGAFLC